VGCTGRMIALFALAAVLAGCAQPGQLGAERSTPERPAPTAGSPAATTPATTPATPQPSAGPAPPDLPVLLGAGLVDYPVQVRTPGPAMYTIRTMVLPPGGTTGWHSHPGTETTIVTAGVLTVVQRGGCAPVRYNAGDALFVADAVPHLARNDGSTPVELLTSYLLAPGAPDRFDAPPACPS
jgi:quercetin dioxygenase-like cupin family protein